MLLIHLKNLWFEVVVENYAKLTCWNKIVTLHHRYGGYSPTVILFLGVTEIL